MIPFALADVALPETGLAGLLLGVASATTIAIRVLTYLSPSIDRAFSSRRRPHDSLDFDDRRIIHLHAVTQSVPEHISLRINQNEAGLAEVRRGLAEVLAANTLRYEALTNQIGNLRVDIAAGMRDARKGAS